MKSSISPKRPGSKPITKETLLKKMPELQLWVKRNEMKSNKNEKINKYL